MNHHQRRLRELSLRTAQRQSCVHREWLEQRETINKLRTRELDNVIKHGNTAKDDRLREAMTRLYETRGRAFSGVDTSLTELQRAALNKVIVVVEVGRIDAQPAIFALPAVPILPPGQNNIRATPRQPTAPTAPALH